jgi:hypothetical protein
LTPSFAFTARASLLGYIPRSHFICRKIGRPLKSFPGFGSGLIQAVATNTWIRVEIAHSKIFIQVSLFPS